MLTQLSSSHFLFLSISDDKANGRLRLLPRQRQQDRIEDVFSTDQYQSPICCLSSRSVSLDNTRNPSHLKENVNNRIG